MVKTVRVELVMVEQGRVLFSEIRDGTTRGGGGLSPPPPKKKPLKNIYTGMCINKKNFNFDS